MTQMCYTWGNIMSYHGNIENQHYGRLGFILFKLLPYTSTDKSQRGKKQMMSVWTEEWFSFEFYDPFISCTEGSDIICIHGDRQDITYTGCHVVGRGKNNHGLIITHKSY